MISLDEIKTKTLWSANLNSGLMQIGTYDKVEQFKNDTKLVRVPAASQPLELQPFWLAYEYAFNTLNRRDLVEVDDFYKEWSNNPDEFDPDMRPTKSNLRTFLLLYSSYPASTNLKIENYDGRFVGTHQLRDFTKALDTMGEKVNFNVIEWQDEGIDPQIKSIVIKVVIQCKKLDLVQEFATIANRVAADRVFD